METISSLRGIMAFVKTAENGSFSKAAQELEVSKSHISKLISALETELGTRLFIRSTRKTKLTSLGDRYLQSCREALQQLGEAKREIVDLSDTPRGTLRVTLAGIFGEDYVAPVLIDLAKQYPDLKIELDFSSRIADLIEEKFDVAIRIGHLKNSTLLAQRIASRVEHVVASKDYLSKAPSLLEPKDLALHNCLGEKSHWSFKKRGRTFQVMVRGNFKSNNPRVIQKAALAGLGLARLPGAYTFEEIKRGRLIPVLESFSEGKKDIWVVTPVRPTQNINVRLFIQEIKKSLSRDYSDLQF